MASTDVFGTVVFVCFGLVACDSGTNGAPEDSGAQTTSDSDAQTTATQNATTSVTTSGATTNAATTATQGVPSSTAASSATTQTSSVSSVSSGSNSSSATSSVTSSQASTATPSSQESGADTSETVDSETSTAQSTSTQSADACANTLLCDDFDDDTVGMAPGQPWTVDANGGGIEISNERAFSGGKSVHVTNTQGAYKRAFFSVEGAPLFPAAGPEMYGRMMMWLDATPVGSVHWTFIQGEGPSEDGSYDIFYRYGGQHEGKLMANFETQGKATDCWDHSATVMPTQTWSCLEWRFNVASDEMQFWLDGSEVADIHATGVGEGCVSQDLAGAWPAPAQFEVLRLGWEKYQESAELNAWIDDVAVGTERVGCPAM